MYYFSFSKMSLTIFTISGSKGNILFPFLLGFPECANFVPTKCNGSVTDKSPSSLWT